MWTQASLNWITILHTYISSSGVLRKPGTITCYDNFACLCLVCIIQGKDWKFNLIIKISKHFASRSILTRKFCSPIKKTVTARRQKQTKARMNCQCVWKRLSMPSLCKIVCSFFLSSSIENWFCQGRISYPLQNNNYYYFLRTYAEKQFYYQHFKHIIDLDLTMNMWPGCKNF